VYLVHTAVEADLGNIHILTRNGLDGNLQYLVGGDKEKYLRICDTRYQALNQGIGSQILAFLEEIARQKQCDRINGWLSPVDLNDHGDRLLHFCDKNGFMLTEDKMPYSNSGFYATKYFKYA
jgi:GNAT superfamily N-acetyltransferase